MNEQQKVKQAFNTLLKQIDIICKRCGSSVLERNAMYYEIMGGDSLVTFNMGLIGTSVSTLNDLKSPYPVFRIDKIVLYHKENPVDIERDNDLGVDFKVMEEAAVNNLLEYQSPKFTKAMENKYLKV